MILRLGLFTVAAFFQGVNVLMYPAAATLLTSPNYHGITAHQYGMLFIPMIVGALLISYFGGYFEEKKGRRTVFVTSLFFNGLSAVIFSATELSLKDPALDFVWLLIALFFLGLGFGSMLTILSPYILDLFPKHPHAATVYIFSILCLGASLSPLAFHSMTKIGLWWLNPLVTGSAFFILIFFAFGMLGNEITHNTERNSGPLPALFWLFFLNMFLYAVTSTTYSNWATIYLNDVLKFPNAVASLALSLFWTMMMVGRIIIVGGDRWIPSRLTYIVMPILITASYLSIPFAHSAWANLAVFAFAGLAFSATFPFTFSFAAQTFPGRATTVSGRITTAYMLGYGVAAYGVGYLYDILKMPLKEIFLYSFVLGLLMLVIAVLLMRNKRVIG